jgi:hypothetical protein
MNLFLPLQVKNKEHITNVLLGLLESNYRTSDVSYSYPIEINLLREYHSDVVDLLELAVNDTLQIARVFVTMPNNQKDMDVIHSDGTDDYPKYLALNWPLINTANSYMCYYDAPKLNYQNLETYGAVQLHDPAKAKTLVEFELLEPCLVRIDIPHNIKNFNNHHRVIISFRFKNELKHINF